MPPPFPKDRQDHLLPGRSCLFFAKALTGKAARNGTGTGSASGKQTGMRGVFAPFPASPKAPTAEPIPSGNGGKTPSSCSTPALFRPHHEPRRGPAHGPPRFPVFADCPSPLSVKGKMPYTFSNLKRHNARKQFRCPATRCGFYRKRRFPAERAFAPDSAVRPRISRACRDVPFP